MEEREVALESISKASGIEKLAIQDNMDLVADLGIDSVKAMELLVDIEDKLDIELSEKVEAGLHTVGELVEGIIELRKS